MQYLDPEIIKAILIAAWAGVTAYLHKIYTKKVVFSKLGMLAEVSAAALAGYLTFTLCRHFNVDSDAVGAITGISGYAGIRALNFGEKLVMDLVTKFFNKNTTDK